MVFKERNHRSVIKTVTYRILIIITNGAIVFLSTSQLDTTFHVLGISSITSTVIYFAHERAWNNVHWGKKKLGKTKQNA